MYKGDLCIHCGRCIPVCPENIHYLTTHGEKPLPDSGASPRHEVNRNLDCIGCRRCESVCPKQALSIAGENKTISEALEIIEQDAVFYLSSGGGVTLGGGEVTAQPEFAANLLMECKRLGLHTAIETCGYTKLDPLLKIAQFTDLFLYDLKHIDSDRHYELTGVRNERILDNLRELLQRGLNVKIRMPLIRGLNDSRDTLRRTMEFLRPFQDYKNFQGIDVLPYHKLGINKYKQLDMQYSLDEDLSYQVEELEDIAAFLKGFDLQLSVIRH